MVKSPPKCYFDSIFSSWFETIIGVPQDSNLEHLLFNPFVPNVPFLYPLKRVQKGCIGNKWFNSFLKNLFKINYLQSSYSCGESTEDITKLAICLDGHNIKYSWRVMQKLKSSVELQNGWDKKQAKLMYNFFILSQFNFCSIIWLFCSKTNFL